MPRRGTATVVRRKHAGGPPSPWLSPLDPQRGSGVLAYFILSQWASSMKTRTKPARKRPETEIQTPSLRVSLSAATRRKEIAKSAQKSSRQPPQLGLRTRQWKSLKPSMYESKKLVAVSPPVETVILELVDQVNERDDVFVGGDQFHTCFADAARNTSIPTQPMPMNPTVPGLSSRLERSAPQESAIGPSWA